MDVDAVPRRKREEWVGAFFPLPEGILPEVSASRPNVAVWIDSRTGLMLGYGLINEDAGPGAFRAIFMRTVASPAIGPPRRPGRVRVADETLAGELRGALPGVQVVVAPTPEIEALKLAIEEYLAPEEPQCSVISDSYLESGRVRPSDAAGFFDAAARLYRSAPWQYISDEDVLAVDCPELGLEDACIVVTGALSQTPGFVVFDSAASYLAFRDALDAGETNDPWPLPADSFTLNVGFERGAELPKRARREILRGGWTVADPLGYPTVGVVGAGARRRPHDARDLLVATAIAEALAIWLERRRDVFSSINPHSCGDAIITHPLSTALWIEVPHPQIPYEELPEEYFETVPAMFDGPDPFDVLEGESEAKPRRRR